MKSVVWLVTLCFVASLGAPIARAEEKATPQISWGEDYIKVRGLGTFEGAATSRKLIIAREKAKLRAERDLLGIIHELRIDSETTLRETMETEEYSEVIKRNIQGTLKGAKILAEGQLNKNTYEVIMGVKLSDIRKATTVARDPDRTADEEENPLIIPSRNFMNLGDPGVTNLDYMKDPKYLQAAAQPIAPIVAPPAGTEPVVTDTGTGGRVTTMITDSAPVAAATPPRGPLTDDQLDAALVGALPGLPTVTAPEEKGPLPKTPFVPPSGAEVKPAAGGYTCLIVDGRRLDADRAFWPRVLGPNEEVIYGNYDASVDFLQDEGAVAYCTSLAEAKECNRHGDSPLVVKACDVFGKYKADLVLSAEDAEKVKAAAVRDGFLKNYKVIFLLK